MRLIKVLPRENNTFIKTYRGTQGSITHVWKTEYGTKVANCDNEGNPRTLLDIAAKRMTTYIRSQDGSTIIKEGKKITRMPQLIFADIIETFFK